MRLTATGDSESSLREKLLNVSAGMEGNVMEAQPYFGPPYHHVFEPRRELIWQIE
jgi:hypothetical protein